MCVMRVYVHVSSKVSSRNGDDCVHADKSTLGKRPSHRKALLPLINIAFVPLDVGHGPDAMMINLQIKLADGQGMNGRYVIASGSSVRSLHPTSCFEVSELAASVFCTTYHTSSAALGQRQHDSTQPPAAVCGARARCHCHMSAAVPHHHQTQHSLWVRAHKDCWTSWMYCQYQATHRSYL